MSFRVKLITYFRNYNRGLILSLLALVSLVYLPFLGNPFVFDDQNFFSGKAAKYYTTSISNFDLRWLPNATLAWTQTLFFDAPHIYRLGNLLLHAVNVVLLFFLLHQFILLATRPRRKIDYPHWGAWLGALFFACHPVAVYAAGYMIQRSILMATLFTLAMQLVYLRGLLNGQKRWLAISVMFYFLAVFSKEHSLMAPVIVIATTVLLRPKIRADKQALWITWLAYLIIGVFVALRAKGVFGAAYEIDAANLLGQQSIVETSMTLHFLSVFTQTGLYFKYLLLWWLPNPAWMSIDMRETFASSISAWQNWLGAISFILYGLFAYKLLLRRGKAGLAGLALLYPWLFFLIDLSTIRVQEPFVLYRSYLWMPGMMLLIPLLVSSLPNHKKTVITLTVVTLSLVPLSWNRLWVFGDDYRLWNDAALLLPNERTPGAARIYYNRGNAELATAQWNKAIADFQRVKVLNPEIEQVYVNIGKADFSLGQYQEAISNFNQAIALEPDYADAYFAKGMTLRHLHADNEALTNIIKSCDLGNQTACLIVAFQNRPK